MKRILGASDFIYLLIFFFSRNALPPSWIMTRRLERVENLPPEVVSSSLRLEIQDGGPMHERLFTEHSAIKKENAYTASYPEFENERSY